MTYNNDSSTTAGTRRLRRVTMGTAALGVAAILGAGPAWAHVHVDADHTEPGEDAVLTFEVPNESEQNAAMTELTVTLPNLTEVSTEQMLGWTARMDRDIAAGTVKSITWTAAPGAGIPPDQFGLFLVAVMMPQADSVSFPATQTYSDSTVVHWDQPTPAGGAEPERPMPTLVLTATPHEGASSPSPSVSASPASAGSASTPPAPDNTARWLAGGALIVAAAGVVLALVRRRRL